MGDISGNWSSNNAGQGSLGLSQLGMASTLSQDQMNLQLQEWEQQQEQLAPWLFAGKSALQELSRAQRGGQFEPGGQFGSTFTPQDFLANKDPGYQWNMDQGTSAINASGAAAGNFGSGNMGVALQNYGQGLASNEYQNAFNRFQTSQGAEFNKLSTLAGEGSAVIPSLTSGAQNYANQGTNILQNQGSSMSAALQNMQNMQYNSNQNSSNQLMSLLGMGGNGLSAFMGGGGMNWLSGLFGGGSGMNYIPADMGEYNAMATQAGSGALYDSGIWGGF